MKKLFPILLLAGLTLTVLIGCSSTGNNNSDSSSTSKEITVVSREDGSGTRGAFIELFGIEEKTEKGKVDKTTTEAIIANKTDVVLTNVAGDPNAVGYVSLGSLNDTVKAVKINDVYPTVENIKNGSYEIARPFNIATKGEPNQTVQDFINFILSAQGQRVVEDNGYIAVADAPSEYKGDRVEGKIVVAGSSSVTPVMEKIKEAYRAINPNVNIEIQLSDSTTGMQAAINGTADIGMASRDLKESELAELNSAAIALDGIAVVVNKENPVDDLSRDEVKGIFVGEITDWNTVME